MRYCHFTPVLIHAYKRYHLIERAFGIKLHLRMLIRNAKRLYRRLTGVHNAAAVIRALAKAFRPKLRIPIGNVL